jgi:hypothetical protein
MSWCEHHPLITDEQFDKLSNEEQMRYLYCPNCNMYYLARISYKHLCGGVMAQSDIDKLFKEV